MMVTGISPAKNRRLASGTSGDQWVETWRQPETKAIDLWLAYGNLELSQQRVFRSLVFDAAYDASTSTAIARTSASKISALHNDLPFRLDNLVTIAYGANWIAIAPEWDLAQSALPAFVPEHWIAEVNAWLSESAEEFQLDWED